jgi:hypothetical protein
MDGGGQGVRAQSVGNSFVELDDAKLPASDVLVLVEKGWVALFTGRMAPYESRFHLSPLPDLRN